MADQMPGPTWRWDHCRWCKRLCAIDKVDWLCAACKVMERHEAHADADQPVGYTSGSHE